MNQGEALLAPPALPTERIAHQGKDGVFGDASRLFSRLYGIRENRALGSLAAGRVAESDWASVWEAIIVNLFSAGPTRGNSSPATAPLKAGIDPRRARGNIQSYSARSIGAIDSQVAGPLALVGEQGNQPRTQLPLLCLVLAGEGSWVLLLVADFDGTWPRVARGRDRPSLDSCCGGLGARSYFAALDKAHGRVDDNLVALLDPVADFDLRAQIARHRHLADMRPAILDHGDLQAITVENDCIRRH